jgi:hypothetical protein
MTDIKLNNNLQKRTLGQWLFNPFQFIAGGSALLVGLAFILITVYLGSLSKTHFDGVLDIHTGKAAPLWLFFAEVLSDWFWISVTLLIAGHIVSRSSFRAIDVFGTQALARAPYLLSALATLPKGFGRFIEFIASKSTHQTPAVTLGGADVLCFFFGIVISLLVIIWAVVLMYRAYAISCNVKGSKAIFSFIAALIVAEILSKLALLLLAYREILLPPV